jgi:hypothetical protein
VTAATSTNVSTTPVPTGLLLSALIAVPMLAHAVLIMLPAVVTIINFAITTAEGFGR